MHGLNQGVLLGQTVMFFDIPRQKVSIVASHRIPPRQSTNILGFPRVTDPNITGSQSGVVVTGLDHIRGQDTLLGFIFVLQN